MKIRQIVFISIIGYILLSYLLIVVANPYNKEQFDSTQWINGDYQKRTAMVNSLLKSDIILGKTKEQISSILGESITYIIDTTKTFGYPVSDAWFNLILRDDNFILVDFNNDGIAENIRLGGW